ncbi:MAG: uroporphyrinogen-III synthase [Alphaproteobacteria bacterium]
MTVRALVTRPGEDAGTLAGLLAARGLEVAFEPLLAIEILPQPVDLGGVQAILVTSANGARALAACTAERDLPVFAVGDASARAARALGFTSVDSADGDVAALAALVTRRLRPEAGALFQAAGSVVAGDLGGDLARAGFAVRKVRLYEARTATALSPATATLLRQGGLDLALFYSPRTAATFVDLVRRVGLENGVASISAYCLSEAVRSTLVALPWRIARVAVRPDQEALLALLDGDLAAGCLGTSAQGEVT